jgi:hypothetical protein
VGLVSKVVVLISPGEEGFTSPGATTSGEESSVHCPTLVEDVDIAMTALCSSDRSEPLDLHLPSLIDMLILRHRLFPFSFLSSLPSAFLQNPPQSMVKIEKQYPFAGEQVM